MNLTLQGRLEKLMLRGDFIGRVVCDAWVDPCARLVCFEDAHPHGPYCHAGVVHHDGSARSSAALLGRFEWALDNALRDTRLTDQMDEHTYARLVVLADHHKPHTADVESLVTALEKFPELT